MELSLSSSLSSAHQDLVFSYFPSASDIPMYFSCTLYISHTRQMYHPSFDQLTKLLPEKPKKNNFIIMQQF
jgi:hypothetical protein